MQTFGRTTRIHILRSPERGAGLGYRESRRKYMTVVGDRRKLWGWRRLSERGEYVRTVQDSSTTDRYLRPWPVPC
jgi:hypothetical protein